MSSSAGPSLAVAVAFVAGLAGCSGFKGVVAESGDFTDYRAFRMAEADGDRLRRAQDYLEAHPRGAWAREVGAAFAREEPAWFEDAKTSRAKASEYLTWLPRGPHAAAAIAVLTAFDTRIEDEETDRMLKEARRTESTLAQASAQRRVVGDAVLDALAALTEEGVYGAAIDETPSHLRRVLGGEGRSTWGRSPTSRTRDVFFSIPTKLERESRILSLAVTLGMDGQLVRSGTVAGADLFVSWAEADEMRPHDPTDPSERAQAARHAIDVLSGFFEARLPPARCRVPGTGEELFVRRCDGWEVIAKMGEREGEVDSIRVRGPSTAEMR
jgi:hypothetical protein